MTDINFDIVEETISVSIVEESLVVDLSEVEPLTIDQVEEHLTISLNDEALVFEIVESGPPGPVGPQGATGPAGDELAVPYARRVDISADGLTIYKGWAVVGTADNGTVWRIQRITLNAEGDATTLWPVDTGGTGLPSSSFIFTWDNRLSLSYG